MFFSQGAGSLSSFASAFSQIENELESAVKGAEDVDAADAWGVKDDAWDDAQPEKAPEPAAVAPPALPSSWNVLDAPPVRGFVAAPPVRVRDVDAMWEDAKPAAVAMTAAATAGGVTESRAAGAAAAAAAWCAVGSVCCWLCWIGTVRLSKKSDDLSCPTSDVPGSSSRGDTKDSPSPLGVHLNTVARLSSGRRGGSAGTPSMRALVWTPSRPPSSGLRSKLPAPSELETTYFVAIAGAAISNPGVSGFEVVLSLVKTGVGTASGSDEGSSRSSGSSSNDRRREAIAACLAAAMAAITPSSTVR